MSLSADQFFALLPAVYRTRDAANGGALQALFRVMAAQSDIVEQNIRQLYDDQFIETCDSWVIPYIGDLIGYNSIYQIAAGIDRHLRPRSSGSGGIQEADHHAEHAPRAAQEHSNARHAPLEGFGAPGHAVRGGQPDHRRAPNRAPSAHAHGSGPGAPGHHASRPRTLQHS
jgi:hypothetical protein